MVTPKYPPPMSMVTQNDPLCVHGHPKWPPMCPWSPKMTPHVSMVTQNDPPLCPCHPKSLSSMSMVTQNDPPMCPCHPNFPNNCCFVNSFTSIHVYIRDSACASTDYSRNITWRPKHCSIHFEIASTRNGLMKGSLCPQEFSRSEDLNGAKKSAKNEFHDLLWPGKDS